jgi:hypothetical protein
LIESQWIDPKGNLIRKDVYAYTDQKLVQELSYDRTGKLIEKTVKTYNPEGLLEYETTTIPSSLPRKLFSNTMGRNDLLKPLSFWRMGRRHPPRSGRVSAPTASNTNMNRVAEFRSKDFMKRTELKRKPYRWTYDPKGNVTQYEIESGSSTTKFVYRYEFDSFGNWTKSIATSTSIQKGLDVFGKRITRHTSEPLLRNARSRITKISRVTPTDMSSKRPFAAR